MSALRGHTLYFCIIVMMVALFSSRAILSVAMMLFVAVSFLHDNTREHLRRFFSSPLLWGMSLLLMLPLISGLWSEDKQQWMDMVRIKLPLFFLPLAFAGPFDFSEKQWNWLARIFIVSIIGGTLWSFFHYAENAAAINEGYLRAGSMITPLENDRVRFSWLVSVAVLLCGRMYFLDGLRNWEKYFLLAAAAWFIIYLHLLAVRTGLFSFYIALLVVIGWLIKHKLRRQYGFILLLLLISLPLIAYFTLPTFQNRVKYFRYEWGYFTKTHYLPGANDAVRIISLKAGWNMMKENPAAGVGYGDVMLESKKWYASRYPEMRESDMIFPSGEWMMYGAGCGIPGIVLFTLVMCIPFFIRMTHRLPWWILNGTAALSFVADIGLEVQFGVFVYSFIVLWWWKREEAEKA